MHPQSPGIQVLTAKSQMDWVNYPQEKIGILFKSEGNLKGKEVEAVWACDQCKERSYRLPSS